MRYRLQIEFDCNDELSMEVASGRAHRAVEGAFKEHHDVRVKYAVMSCVVDPGPVTGPEFLEMKKNGRTARTN